MEFKLKNILYAVFVDVKMPLYSTECKMDYSFLASMMKINLFFKIWKLKKKSTRKNRKSRMKQCGVRIS